MVRWIIISAVNTSGEKDDNFVIIAYNFDMLLWQTPQIPNTHYPNDTSNAHICANAQTTPAPQLLTWTPVRSMAQHCKVRLNKTWWSNISRTRVVARREYIGNTKKEAKKSNIDAENHPPTHCEWTMKKVSIGKRTKKKRNEASNFHCRRLGWFALANRMKGLQKGITETFTISIASLFSPGLHHKVSNECKWSKD